MINLLGCFLHTELVPTAPEIDHSVLFVEVLKVLNDLNFQLDATIPLSRRGSLGMRSTRELLVFKGYAPQ